MILFPSVDKLLERVDSRYSLIMLASKRAHLSISTGSISGGRPTRIRLAKRSA